VDDDVKKILYVQTHGVDMPERSATPFYLAAAGAAMDAEVGIYFTMNGPTLLEKGVPEKLIVPKKGGGGRELAFFIKQAQEIGVKLYVCQPSLALHALKVEDWIDGGEMIGGAAFNDMALNADAVIAF
jgi:predicted peroxiredoxin